MPLLVCISAANIHHAPRGTSYRACELACLLATERDPAIRTDIVALVDHDLRPCTGCGSCFGAGRCSADDDFNVLYARISRADGLIIVSPHYAPIPAKMAMLLEKTEQIAFLDRFHNGSRRSPLSGKPAGIIGYGGGTEEAIEGYTTVVLRAIANALMYPVDMDVVRLGPDEIPGVVFPVARVSRAPDSPFPVQEYDWDDIRSRIAPLVDEVVSRMTRGRRPKHDHGSLTGPDGARGR